MTKFCVDCKHLVTHTIDSVPLNTFKRYICNAPDVINGTRANPVTGVRPLVDCEEARDATGLCAPFGKHWESKA